jgi:pyrroline-5-carboxylate reductase
MSTYQIGIIGAGNMGTAIAKGLSSSGYCNASEIILSDADSKKSTELIKDNFNFTSNNTELVTSSNIIIIAVKPFHVQQLLKDIKDNIDANKQILVSIAAGISSNNIQSIIGNTTPLILAMPNTAISVKQSVTFLASNNAKTEQLKLIATLFENVGQTFIIDEQQMGAATVLGSCATAFAMRFMRASMLGGIETGFKADVAKAIIAQVLKGAAELIQQNNSSPEDEIDKVSTPKGITITGLNEMENNGFSSSIIRGMIKAYQKIENK